MAGPFRGKARRTWMQHLPVSLCQPCGARQALPVVERHIRMRQRRSVHIGRHLKTINMQPDATVETAGG